MRRYNLGDYRSTGVPVLAGQDYGLAESDRTEDAVVVEIPADVFAVTSSFFQGLFGPSVRAAGSREGFLERFRFEGGDEVLVDIETGIENALSLRSRKRSWLLRVLNWLAD